MDEQVDILAPPLFDKTGHVKDREQAYDDGDWVGTFNLWIVQREPRPAIVYQIRGPHKSWAPNKMDVAVGARYQAGESLTDGLREAREELGKDYDPKALTYLGRKIYVGFDTKNREKHEVIELYMTEDDSPLGSYILEDEVYAICSCPLEELLKAHADKRYSFTVEALTRDGATQTITVNAQSFPENFDNYHLKIVLLAKRYLGGEQHLIY